MWTEKKYKFNKYFQSIKRGGRDTFAFWTVEGELKSREIIKAGFKVIYLARITTTFVHELKNSFRMPRGAGACVYTQCKYI